MVVKIKLGGGNSFVFDGNDGSGEEKIPVIRGLWVCHIKWRRQIRAAGLMVWR